MRVRRDEVSPRVDSPRHLWRSQLYSSLPRVLFFLMSASFSCHAQLRPKRPPVQTKRSKETSSQAKQTTNPKTQLGIKQTPRDFQVGSTLWSIKNYYKFDVTR